MEELKKAINNTDRQASFKLNTMQEPNNPEDILFDVSYDINNSADQKDKDEFF